MIIGDTIIWKVKLNAHPGKVYHLLTTDSGRSSFWAESSEEIEGIIHFHFPNGQKYLSKVLKQVKDELFIIDYFKSIVEFQLTSEQGYTILTLKNRIPDSQEIIEVNAGWVSVLISLKCACDHQVDIRNHNKGYCWDQGFVEN